MKKKIFALITAVALVAILCLSLVACDDNENNDGNDLSPITFSGNMSKDEIIKRLDDIANFTIEMYNGDDYGAYYFGKDWMSAESNDGEENGAAYKHWMFSEDGRFYVFTLFCEENNEWEETQCLVTIDEEIIAEDVEEIAQIRDGYREEFINKINAGEYVIVDGNIKFTTGYNDGESHESYVMLRDVNSTTMPTLPEEYRDYKNFELTTGEDAE